MIAIRSRRRKATARGRTAGGARERRALSALRALEAVKGVFGAAARASKLALLAVLAGSRLARARDVLRLHEALCFLRAYPDDEAVLGAAEHLLARFDRRPDLRRHRAALAGSGIAGTETRFRFYAHTASWLARRWGDHLRIDWTSFDRKEELERFLNLLAL